MKNRALKIYKTIIIILAAFWMLFLCVDMLLLNPSPAQYTLKFWTTFLIFTALIIPAGKLALKMPGIGEIRFSDILYYSCFMLFSPAVLGLLICVSILQNFFHKIKKTSKKNLLFITANTLLIYTAGSFVYSMFSTPFANNYAFIKNNLPVFFLASAVCYILKNALDNTHKVLLKKIPAYYFFNFHGNKTLVYLFIISPLGFFTGAIAALNLSVFLLFTIPMALIFRSLQGYTRLLWEIREVLKKLALLTDKKENEAVFHSHSVAGLGRKIALNLRLNEETVEKIYTAGLLHDLGKVGVSDRLLNKETFLTYKEFDKIKNHPSIGSELIKNLSGLAEEASIIRHHHENYNGEGYPDGLYADKIPLGARILAVCETYDSLTSKRSYKDKLSGKEALEEIRMLKGFQFDPEVVEALMRVMKNEN
ncbi:MAG: HD domain-containing phosphohydrolase [Armatimonadota bacterium]